MVTGGWFIFMTLIFPTPVIPCQKKGQTLESVASIRHVSLQVEERSKTSCVMASSHGIPSHLKPPRPTSKGAANARPASGAVGTSSGRKPGSTKVNAGKNGETQGKMI